MLFNKKIVNFLLLYRNVFYSVINEILVKLFYGRNFRICLDLIRFDIRKIVIDKIMKNVVEERGIICNFKENDYVIVWDYRNDEKWIDG